ncbi:hypothetical protein A1l_00020 [Klebsiella phage VLCpiA1l]|nr:hypothetical protein A1l_00020 [Klebsiella phage VLCpiA1l]
MLEMGREYTFEDTQDVYILEPAPQQGIQVRCTNTGEVMSPALAVAHIRSAHLWWGFRYV